MFGNVTVIYLQYFHFSLIVRLYQGYCLILLSKSCLELNVRTLITLVNKDFVPLGKMSVSDVFLDAEFEYVSRISLSPSPFAPG